jgi:hypothetical protein
MPAQDDRRSPWYETNHRFLEISRPATAAEFAIREDFDADLFLHLQYPKDLAILHFTQALECEATVRVRCARVFQFLWPQKAANLIGSVFARAIHPT